MESVQAARDLFNKFFAVHREFPSEFVCDYLFQQHFVSPGLCILFIAFFIWYAHHVFHSFEASQI